MKNKDLSTSLVPGLNNRPGLILGGILIPWVFCFALAIPAFLWMPVGAGDELTAPRIPGGSLSGSAGIIWLNDYETARKQSAERGLPLFMEVGTEGCPWCRQMDTATLSDSRVIARLKADWVCLRVDGKLNPALVYGCHHIHGGTGQGCRCLRGFTLDGERFSRGAKSS